MTFRAFSIGFSAALLALACGSDDNNDTEAVPVPRETCADNQLLAGCPSPDAVDGPGVAAPDVTPPRPAPPSSTPPDLGNDVKALAQVAAQNILAENCGQCHGPALSVAEASGGGMNYINDMDKLVANGKVVPLDSAGSKIIQRMTNGSMPPSQSLLPRVSKTDIDTVAQFIDNPNFWEGVDPAGLVDCTDQLSTFDDLYAEVAQDLAGLDADDALTTRYIALTNRFTSGVCALVSLDRDRQAMFKLVNALSTETTVEKPRPVDQAQTIYAINIEDYGWDQPVTVVIDGVATDFADKWEAIADANDFAVPFVGDDADDAVADSGTTIPVQFSDSLLDAASIGNLYYALIDVDVNQTLPDFILNNLLIDVAANLADEDQIRAGTTKSRISRQDRVLQRDEINARQGVLWQSFDFEADGQNESIFEDPFGFAAGGTEAIFTLPNGMFGFIIADAVGNIVEDSNILVDFSQNNFRAVTMVSCSNCHAQGLIPVVDEVREIALANARVSGLNRDEVEQLEAVYPSAQEFARTVEADSTQFYKAALTKATVPLAGGDPISNVFLRFDQKVTLATAAGDLGVSPQELDDNLNLLDPVLGVLSRGVIDRDDFAAVYVNSLCILSIVNENQPDPQACLDAEALLLQ